MGDTFTDDELHQEEVRARKLADLCLLHGQMDGAKAHRSTGDAIAAELTVRARKRGE